MSMVGTFDGFTSARLGIYAAQHGLRVTGNNISNISTVGYTRQRVDQISLKVGANDRYRSFYDNHVGAGALVTGISQIRDPYLDIRYRNVSTEAYHYDTWLAGLQNVASVLDEVGKGENDGDGLIYAQLQDLADKLRAYSANPTALNERLVRNSASSLAALFHSTANGLQEQFDLAEAEFYDNIDEVNNILTSIRDLNKSIREAEIHGDTALEARDERNRQIDALSQYLDIKVQYSYENVGAGVQVEKLTISLNNANPDGKVHSDESILVDGLYATQLSVPQERPVLNTYGDEYAYLRNYTYLRKIPIDDTDALDQYLLANDLMPDDITMNPLIYTDEDGNQYYIVGTNDPDTDGIVTEANDNYTIQLAKLLNAKGEEWKNTTTRFEEVAGTKIPLNQWTSTIKSMITGDNIGDTFTANEVTYTIVSDDYDPNDPDTFPDGFDADNPPENPVKLSDVSTDEALAAFVFEKYDFNNNDDFADYTATLEGKTIIFTASTDITKGPELNDDPEENALFDVETDTAPTQTYKVGPPDPSKMADAGETIDEHGNVIQTINYVQGLDGKWYRIQIDTEYAHEVTLDDNDLRGILQAQRELLTEEGEFSSEYDVAIDENALTKRGIPYYMKSLDLLAQKFAEAYNRLNQGYAYDQDGYYIDENGNPLDLAGESISIDGLTAGQLEYLITEYPDNYADYFLTDSNGDLLDANGKYILDDDGKHINVNDLSEKLYVAEEPEDPDDPTEPEEPVMVLNTALLSKIAGAVNMNKVLDTEENGGLGLGAYAMGGILFSNRGDGNDTEGITAANISVSYDWSNGVVGLVPTYMMLFADSGGLTHSTQNDNADHMVAMIENSLTYDPRDLFGSDAIGPVLFEGSFNDMFSNMMAVEGEDADLTYVRLATATLRLEDLDYSREGVSGVDLNDEAMDMISFQKAMSAAMRLMTVLDSMLDRLINNTGVTV